MVQLLKSQKEILKEKTSVVFVCEFMKNLLCEFELNKHYIKYFFPEAWVRVRLSIK